MSFDEAVANELTTIVVVAVVAVGRPTGIDSLKSVLYSNRCEFEKALVDISAARSRIESSFYTLKLENCEKVSQFQHAKKSMRTYLVKLGNQLVPIGLELVEFLVEIDVHLGDHLAEPLDTLLVLRTRVDLVQYELKHVGLHRVYTVVVAHDS